MAKNQVQGFDESNVIRPDFGSKGRVFGHTKTFESLISQAQANRLPSAYLMVGDQGVGKATCAHEFALWLLKGMPADMSQIPADDPIRKRAESGGHGDYLYVTKTLNKEGKIMRDISIDSVREVISFMHQTALEGGWRVVIVDAIDDLSRSAANALLKVLEEPPAKSILLLVCHSLGKVLPTIRSRAQILKVNTLDETSMQQFLDVHAAHHDKSDRDAVRFLADGRPGLALKLLTVNGVNLYQAWVEAISAQTLGKPQLSSFLNLMNPPRKTDTAAIDLYDYAPLIIQQFTSRLVKFAVDPESLSLLPQEAETFSALLSKNSMDAYAKLWSELNTLFTQSHKFSLDRRQVLTDIYARF